jgi:Protein of unknown function (DUF2975)
LTNGIDWFIPCAMNANEISPKANPRLNTIKIVSRIAKYVFLAFFLFMIGLDIFFFHTLRIIVIEHSKLAPFLIVSQTVLLVWYWKLSRLFSFYERGMIFSSHTSHCIKFLGVLCIIGWLMDFVACCLFSWPPLSPELNSIYIFQISKSTVTGVSTHTFHTGFFSFDFGTGIDFGTLAAGIAIVLIAFIMDEGRKIHEEQELTV